MNYRILLPALIILLSTTALKAQYTIHGHVTDASKKGIAHATLSFDKKTTETNDKGQYQLVIPNAQAVVINVRAQGYVSQEVLVSTADTPRSVDVILTRGKSLSEVTVTARKPLIEQKPDRMVFNIENSIAGIAGDALDALKKTPGILMMNNQLTIAGKSTVSVMINGRLQQVSGEDLMQLLKSIPADNISKIEVITTPPAKYDAEGNAGLVNLVTKKPQSQGLRGNVTAGYNRNTYNSPSLSTSLNYRRKNLNVFMNAHAAREQAKYTNKSSRYYPGESWKQLIEQKHTEDNGGIQAGVDYNLNKSTTIGFVYTKAVNYYDIEEQTRADIYNNSNTIDSTVQSKAKEHSVYGGKHTVNLNYEWKIDTMGKKLNIDADYYTQDIRRSKDFNIGHYLNDGTATNYGSITRMRNTPSVDIRSVKADLELPIKKLTITLGGKAAFVHNRADIIYEDLRGGDYITDTTRTNKFEYDEQTQAAYITAHRSFGKLSMQVGVRAEHTHTVGYSPTTLQRNETDYTKLFPSGYVQYKMNEKQSLSLNFARRINRPGYNMLNPFRFYYTPNAYIQGNPNLQPSFNYTASLSYMMGPKYTARVYTNYVDNYADRLAQADASNSSTNFTRANIGKATFYGASFSVYLNPASWCEVRGSINGELYNYKLKYYTNSTDVFKGKNGWIEGGGSFFINKSKTLSAEWTAYYYTPRQKDYKRWEGMSDICLGVKAMFLKKNLVVAVNADDIMAKAYWLQTNAVNGTREYSYDDEHSIRITVTYKFGNKNVKGKRDRNAAVEEIQRAN